MQSFLGLSAVHPGHSAVHPGRRGVRLGSCSCTWDSWHGDVCSHSCLAQAAEWGFPGIREDLACRLLLCATS